MSLALVGLASLSSVTVRGAEMIAELFPEFIEVLRGVRRPVGEPEVKPTSLSLGLIGFPLDHSLSPRLHAGRPESVGSARRLQTVSSAACAARGLKPSEIYSSKCARGEMHGLNVTIPHKQTVIPYLDELTPTALAVGAVNTIVYKAGKLIGENTDCPGFLADLAAQLESAGLRELHDRTGNSALVLGAGGSARAVVFGLLQNGWQVSIAARRPEQAQELMRSFSSRPRLVGEMNMLRSEAAQNFQLIVNTTPLGMHPNVEDFPWPANLPFPKKVFVYDLVYNPPETTLLRSARNSGLPAANGLGMLVRAGGIGLPRLDWPGTALGSDVPGCSCPSVKPSTPSPDARSRKVLVDDQYNTANSIS